MTERPMSRMLLLMAVAMLGGFVVTLVLAWPDPEPPPPGPDLPGPTDASLARVLPHERSAHREAKTGDDLEEATRSKAEADDPGSRDDDATSMRSRATLLEVDLFDGFERLDEDDRPRYALVMRPRTASAETHETKVVLIHSGRNRVAGFAPGEWSATLAGLPLAPRSVALRERATERIVWDENDLVRPVFRPFRLIGFDPWGERLTGLRLALEGPRDSTIDIAPIADGSGDLDLLVGPVWEALLVTCPGYATVSLREATYLAPAGAFIGHDPEPDRERIVRRRRGLGVVFH